jgi:hypothetical protein
LTIIVYQETRKLYADVRPGFTEVEVVRFLTDAGFLQVETSIVHGEEESPYFRTLLTVGDRP